MTAMSFRRSMIDGIEMLVVGEASPAFLQEFDFRSSS